MGLSIDEEDICLTYKKIWFTYWPGYWYFKRPRISNIMAGRILFIGIGPVHFQYHIKDVWGEK